MDNLNEHFRDSGYSIHRGAIRPERLPECCRSGLIDCRAAVRYLDCSGRETLLPLRQCGFCGRYYAVCGEKFMLIDNLLRFDVVRCGDSGKAREDQ